MAVERTLSIIKPDAVAKNVIGKIYSRFESNGLAIVAAQMRWLSRAEAEGVLRSSPRTAVFRDLVAFMTSGPVMIQVLEGEDAIAKNRDLMGATDPKKAAPGRSARISRSRSTRMPCTAPMRRKPRRSRSPTSSPRSRSTAVDPARGRR